MNTPISVFIVTLNEAKTIEKAIEAVKCFDETIVVDSGSTDGTVELAQSLGAKVVHQEWLGFSKQKEFAMSLCRNDWVFNVDGDEIVNSDLINEIDQLVTSGQCDAIRVYFEDIFMGKIMHPKSHKRSTVRVFNRHKIEYPQNRLVHENVVVDGRVLNTQSSILHYGYPGVEIFTAKQNKYSSLSAKEKSLKNKRFSALKLMLVFPAMFLKSYILRKMFLSGWRGFIHAMIDANYAFLKEAKLYEFNVTSS